MKTAIIILNYNDYDNTSKYTNIVKNYNSLDKIIIVDNNSNDGMKENLKQLESDKIDVIFSDRNGGYAYGNNFGLKYLESKYNKENFKYVIISNPDVSVEEEAINACIGELENNPNTVIVAPRMYFINGPARRSSWKHRTFWVDVANSTRITEALLLPLLKKGEYTKQDFAKEKINVDTIAGSFFVADISKFKEIGYFDENTFLFYEEDIIARKLEKNNYNITSLNNIKFIHYDSQTIGKVISAKRKIDILFESKKYYHKKYNNVGNFGIIFLDILKNVRKIEIIFEIPIRKLYNNLRK